jgi:hypothetical protein
MSTSQLIELVKALPLEEKNALFELIAADIVDSTPPRVRKAQVEEMLQRQQRWLEGKTQIWDGEEVLRDARERLKRG